LNNKTISRNSNRDFVSVALGDAGCFSMLMTILVQNQSVQGRPTGRMFWHFRGAAIAALNTGLVKDAGSITDETVCTVGMLAYVEVRELLLSAMVDDE
jgi:hypothetical protein